jgi:hypothetical protein
LEEFEAVVPEELVVALLEQVVVRGELPPVVVVSAVVVPLV